MLLGDAHIAKRSLIGNSRSVYTQTAVKHKVYFEYVYSFFSAYCAENYVTQLRTMRDKRINNTYSSLSFTAMQLPCFNEHRELFYLSTVKFVPINKYDLLTPIGLAFWITDDGSRQGSGLHISVYGFTYKYVDRLMFTLQDKFNLKCYIHYNRNNKPRIHIFK